MVFFAVLLHFSSPPLVSQEFNGEFARGDCNTNGIVDIPDVIANLSCLFLGNECTSYLEICGIDEDGVVNISDSISLLFCLFLGQKFPVSPTVVCGVSHVISLLVLYPQSATTHGVRRASLSSVRPRRPGGSGTKRLLPELATLSEKKPDLVIARLGDAGVNRERGRGPCIRLECVMLAIMECPHQIGRPRTTESASTTLPLPGGRER